MRKIQFYRTTSGYCPVEDFLDSLSGKEAQKVAWVLQLIEELDIITTQYFKKLIDTNAIWEVKIKFGSNIFRILGFLASNNMIVLNHAFQKKTQKTPKSAIKLAEKRKQDFINRERKYE
mgnify:FL=1